jgi:hypothetical protein
VANLVIVDPAYYLETRFIMESDLVSKLIGFSTNSLWCHCEGLSRDGLHWVGAHADGGVQARPLDWAKGITRERRYRKAVSHLEYELAMGFQESHIGMPYNFENIVGLSLHRRIGVSDHEIICSSFELRRYMATGAERLYPLNVLERYSYLITPETLHLSPIWMGCEVPQ